MSNVLILGGGFAGVVAAETLAKEIAPEHQITLVSRDKKFLFYPALVRLAFGKCAAESISYNLRAALNDRRIRFVQAEVAGLDTEARRVTLSRGDVEGEMPFDYLVFALGRRLATERVTGFFEHAHHLLNVKAALKFGKAIENFHTGHAVIGSAPGARLPVPVYETAFALSRLLESRGERERAQITIVSPMSGKGDFGEVELNEGLRDALQTHHIEFLPDFPISEVTATDVRTSDGHIVPYNLLMLVPPFRGASAAIDLGATSAEGYLRVDRTMQVRGLSGVYADGDAVDFPGPKMGYMAVRQAEVAAANIAAEIENKSPEAVYDHEMMLVVDEGGRDSLYLHKELWTNEPASVRQGYFWSWAKRAHERYWQRRHS